MHCSQCGSKVKASADADQLECPFCQATTLLVPESTSSAKIKKLKRNQTVDLSKFTIEVDGPDLEIWWAWDRFKGLAGILIAGGVSWYAAWHVRGAAQWSDWQIRSGEDLLSLVFALAPVCMAIGLAYTAITFLFNRTTIAIQDRSLVTSHGPLPYYPAQKIPLAALQELKVHRKVTTDSDGKPVVTFELHACTISGRKLKLIRHETSHQIPSAVKSVLEGHIQYLDKNLTEALLRTNDSSESQQSSRPRKVLLICPRCGNLIPPPRKITSSRCRSCGAEITIPDDVWQSVGLHPPRRRNIEHEPVTFVLRHHGPTLTISANWDRESSRIVFGISAIFLAIAICGILWACQIDGWKITEVLDGGTFFLSLASVFIGAVASFISYIALCQMLNRTIVTLGDSRISVWNGPIPIRKKSQLATAKIHQISIHPNRQRYHPYPSFNLEAISDYGATLELFFDQAELKGLQTIEKLIERHLKLANRLVEDELK
ncbi:MAG TPA: hypothetical protein DIW81_07940 [Planctomycetaceae bacterium]|nr:hypothetical protein [Planctomycetaceae bacterium]